MKNILLLTLGVLFASESAFTTPMIIQCGQSTGRQSVKGKESRVKTFTDIYWTTLNAEMQKSLPPTLLIKGNVIGDFHFNNLGISYNFNPNVNKAELVLNDLDDSGNNYILGDFIKYLSFLKTYKIEGKGETLIGKDAFKFKKIFDAYISGLENEKYQLLRELEKKMNLHEADALEKRDSFIAKKMKDFPAVGPSTDPNLPTCDLKLTICNPELKITFTEFEKLPLLKANLINGRDYQVNKSGSSQGQSRFLFLLQNPQSKAQAVIEFKQLTCAATHFQNSQDISLIYKDMATYLKRQNETALNPIFLLPTKLVQADGKIYLQREKQPNYMGKIVEEALKDGDYQNLAETFAYLLGQFHSRQVSPEFINELTQSSNKIFTVSDDTSARFFELTSKKAMQ